MSDEILPYCWLYIPTVYDKNIIIHMLEALELGSKVR